MRKPLPKFGTAVKDELRSKFVRVVKFGRRGKKNVAPSQHCKGKDSWSLIPEKQHPHLIRNQTNARKQCLVLVKSSRGKTKVPGSAVTNARFASLHGLPVAPSPSRRRPFHYANRALVTSLHGEAARAAAFRLRLGGGVALRLRSAKRFSPPSAPLSPLADRRPKPENPLTRASC